MKSPLLLAAATLLAASGLGTFVRAADGCRLASTDDVNKALHVAIVRAEPAGDDKSGCKYSIKGKPSSAVADHGIAMGDAMSGQTLDPASQKMVQGFFGAMLGGQDTDPKNVRHPGEVPIFIFDVQTGDAISQMNIHRQALGAVSPLVPISGLGDEAFSSSDSMMFVRKGDKLLHIIYTGCPCATKDVVPLARQLLGGI
jgi:hypothetical protein